GEHRYSMELFPNSNLINQVPNKTNTFNINSRKRSGDFCLFTFDKNEIEFNNSESESFLGLIQTYKSFKQMILANKFKSRKLKKATKENELTLKGLIEYYKEDSIKNFFYSTTPNSDTSKIDIIVELKPTSTHLRFVTGNTNKGGEGNLTLPVIY